MRLLFADVETLREYTLFSFWDKEKDIWYEFSINKWQNDLTRWVKFMEGVCSSKTYLVMFNSISFDSQVMEWMLRRCDKWYDKTGIEIAEMVWKKASDIIDNQNYDKLPQYKEEDMSFCQIDLFRVFNFGNTQRRTSLKWVEFSADLPDIEPMPLSDSKVDLTPDEIEMIRLYCRKDIRATYELWRHAIGEVENEVYKGKDKIQERLDASEEFSLPSKAISYSDVKLGETINLLGYMQEANVSINELYERKRNRPRTRRFTCGECIPTYVGFKTPILKEFMEKMSPVVVNLTKKQEFKLVLGDLEYNIAKGGLHTKNKPAFYQAGNGYLLIEFDCSSQYPASIVKRKLFPVHLGEGWLTNYKRLIDKRIDAKDRGKKEKKYQSIAETYKLAINGGGFGKLGDPYSVQYDPFSMYQCTIGNEFEVLMLIEWLMEAGIKILSANTDGALCKVRKEDEKVFYEICSRWEKHVGNTELGKLEYTYYNKYILTSVNAYLGIKTDGTVKQKDDFTTDFELHRNKSRRIVPLALKEYFTKGTDIAEYINSHTKIFDFCIGVKASRDYYFKAVDHIGQADDYKRIIRYFVSKNGKKLLKVKAEGSAATGNPVTQCEAPDKKTKEVRLCTVANHIPVNDTKEYQVDYQYYTNKAKKIVALVEANKDTNSNQLSLF